MNTNPSIRRWEWAGVALLAAALVAALKVSWRKWPDPVIDFGRELYVPWQISKGAVLYRDLDSIYGPLSQYFNALVFSVTGPGMMWLVAVNLAIYTIIVILLYRAVREGWGWPEAWAGTLVFITVFSFGQYVGVGNYNFATPYSHETTHGFLLVLALVNLGASWLRSPGAGKAFAAGLCAGLCALLKVEILFSAGVVVLGVAARAVTTGARRDARQVAGFVGGLALPVAVATACFSSVAPPGEAFAWANNGLPGLFAKAAGPHQAAMLGTPTNLFAVASLGALSVALAAGAAWLTARIHRAAGLALAGAAGLAALFLPWIEAGKLLPAWLLAAGFLLARRKLPPSAANMQWLLLLAAAAMLARMAFNPRIYHYGYFQASLAAVVAVATAISLGRANKIYLWVIGVFLAVGVAQLTGISRHYFRLKGQPIAEGADRFYGFPGTVILEQTREALAALPGNPSTLVVAPEGIMLNYLLRKESPVSMTAFHPRPAKQWEALISRLRESPPDHVVLLSRDLREYGAARFGDSPAHGEALVKWVNNHYRPIEKFGRDPLDANSNGAIIYQAR